MYKEYRDTTLNGAVDQLYHEMGSRHRCRFPSIQIIKTATVPAAACKRANTQQVRWALGVWYVVLRDMVGGSHCRSGWGVGSGVRPGLCPIAGMEWREVLGHSLGSGHSWDTDSAAGA